MNYLEMLENSKKNIGEFCKVCKECNGISCKGKIPGPGGKGLGLGFIRNYEDLRKIRLNMDTVYLNKGTNTEIELFGKKFKYPVFAAPVGGVQIHYSDLYNDLTYSKAVINGCHKAGTIAFTGDGVKDEVFTGTLKAIKANDGWGVPTIKPWSKEEVIKKIKLSENAGAFAVAMDIDAAGLSILAAQGKPVSPLSKEDLKEIVNSTKLPFILKGVMSANVARKAIEAGVYGVIVSNHGGRVLDETPSTIEVLPEIVEEVQGKIKVFIDGGFRSGIDVFKAIALGADAALIARPYAISVYGAGEEGVELYTEKIGRELAEAMIMTGASNLSEIDEDKIR
ncbi:alpha-hydroxy-acid oxidizing protein [Helicovermis profundi]|uniref:L-lactate oxidase n=1 Tax=Helicovermis profundi TaxID=3065157 RepID=A0AAU9E1H9_9FIRM|nr:alpha-hydroxy-acid oxidizing protein [Clostridia bacterium S502]